MGHDILIRGLSYLPSREAEVTLENDTCTGATPGRLLRHGLG